MFEELHGKVYDRLGVSADGLPLVAPVTSANAHDNVILQPVASAIAPARPPAACQLARVLPDPYSGS